MRSSTVCTCLVSEIHKLVRAGFSLSMALFRKKCVGPSPRAADPIFSHHRLSAVRIFFIIFS